MKTMSLAFVIFAAGTGIADAACGDRGGPGYRKPWDRKCASWDELARGVCGNPPSRLCIEERVTAIPPNPQQVPQQQQQSK
jgi:hypothetical protein